MKKHIGVIMCGLFLAGCATQRVVMPSEEYARIAQLLIRSNYCNQQGWISVETAAQGIRFAQADAIRFDFDKARMDENIAWVNANHPKLTQTECRDLAVRIVNRRVLAEQNIAAINNQIKSTEESLNATKSHTTYCNKIGMQVFCNSY